MMAPAANNNEEFSCGACDKTYSHKRSLIRHWNQSISCAGGRGQGPNANPAPVQVVPAVVAVVAQPAAAVQPAAVVPPVAVARPILLARRIVNTSSTPKVKEDEDVPIWSLPYTKKQLEALQIREENAISEEELENSPPKKTRIVTTAHKADCRTCGQPLPPQEETTDGLRRSQRELITDKEKEEIKARKATCYLKNKYETLLSEPLFEKAEINKTGEREIPVWLPSDLSEDEVENFLREWKALKVDAEGIEIAKTDRVDEEAMLALYSSNYNVKTALEKCPYVMDIKEEELDAIRLEEANKAMTKPDNHRDIRVVALGGLKKSEQVPTGTRKEILPHDCSIRLADDIIIYVRRGGSLLKGDQISAVNGVEVKWLNKGQLKEMIDGMLEKKETVMLTVNQNPTLLAKVERDAKKYKEPARSPLKSLN